MKNLKKISEYLLFAFLFFSFAFVSANANEIDPNKEYRVALVIGNSDYKKSPLKNPVNDAKDIASALQDLGFDVVLGTNLTRDEINQKVSEFSPMLAKADIGFFYFAGHGFQYEGENYLVPVAFDINNENDIPREALSTGSILKKMDDAGNAVNIVVLDACRNNPYAGSFSTVKRSLKLPSDANSTAASVLSDANLSRGLTRSNVKGLTPLNGPSGSLIAYATAPGQVAADGSGSNGLYTQYILNYIKQPDVAIEQVFKKVRIGVMKDTSGSQIPWENSSLLGDFYFKDSGKLQVIPLDAITVLKSTNKNNRASHKNLKSDRSQQLESQFWSSVEKSNSTALYRAYIKKYPQGYFVEIAKIKLDDFSAKLKSDPINANHLKSGQVNTAQINNIPQANKMKQREVETVDKKTAIGDTFKMTDGQIDSLSDEHKELNPSIQLSDFVSIKAGCFTMGSAFGEEARQNDELDHEVCVSHDFMLGKYEVTQAQWQSVMGKNPAYFKGCGLDCPVERVSWNDVQSFIFRLNILTQGHYRLPTEAEWEYAARSSTHTSTYTENVVLEGTNNAPGLDKIAWYSGNTKAVYKGGKYCEDWDDKQFAAVRCGTQKIGKKQPNAWGLYDMIGNVWELTYDWYGNFPSNKTTDPKGAKSGDLKVAKGGSWSGSLQQNRAASRYGFAVKERSNNLGFRLVR